MVKETRLNHYAREQRDKGSNFNIYIDLIALRRHFSSVGFVVQSIKILLSKSHRLLKKSAPEQNEAMCRNTDKGLKQ